MINKIYQVTSHLNDFSSIDECHSFHNKESAIIKAKDIIKKFEEAYNISLDIIDDDMKGGFDCVYGAFCYNKFEVIVKSVDIQSQEINRL